MGLEVPVITNDAIVMGSFSAEFETVPGVVWSEAVPDIVVFAEEASVGF